MRRVSLVLSRCHDVKRTTEQPKSKKRKAFANPACRMRLFRPCLFLHRSHVTRRYSTQGGSQILQLGLLNMQLFRVTVELKY